jgi:8-oxo-dGTP pyrophosphatase MutT (NUDIX family)
MVERFKMRLKSRSWFRLMHGSKWVAAGALIFDPDGKVLLVKSRLRQSWEYPAGASDGTESPIDTCRREVREEVGLSPARYRLVGIDFFHRATPNGNLFFSFAAEVSHAQAATVELQVIEIMDHRWVTRDEAAALIAPRLRSRLQELFAAYDQDKPVYLHTGEPVI